MTNAALVALACDTKGRFEPLELNKWLGTHTINAPDMRELDDSGAARTSKGQ